MEIDNPSLENEVRRLIGQVGQSPVEPEMSQNLSEEKIDKSQEREASKSPNLEEQKNYEKEIINKSPEVNERDEKIKEVSQSTEKRDNKSIDMSFDGKAKLDAKNFMDDLLKRTEIKAVLFLHMNRKKSFLWN